MTARTCSTAGCNGEHIARGMCAMHYCRWQRANPSTPRQSDETMRKMLDALPGRQDQIIARSGMTSPTVKRALAALRKAEAIHIGRFKPPSTVGSKFMPIFVLGKGKDAVVTPQVRKNNAMRAAREGDRRRQAVKVVTRQAKATAKAHGWAASLMACL